MDIAIQKRISKVIIDLGFNPTSFSKEIGANQSTIYAIIKNEASPGYDTIYKIASTKFKKRDQLIQIDCNWLILGQGDMYKSDDSVGFRADILKRIKILESLLHN